MKVARKVYFRGQAALICSQLLGNSQVSSWDDFLADCVRERQQLFGLTLLPCGRMEDRGVHRPVYDESDIVRFVHRVQAEDPVRFGPGRLKPMEVMLDPTIPWRFNRIAPPPPPAPPAP